MHHPPSSVSPAWHALDTGSAASRLEADPSAGLGAAEAARRLAQLGPNRLAEQPPRPAWLKFLDQFKSLLILILICAALLAGLIGDFKDAVVILVVVLFNATLGFYQEHRAEATLAALKKMLTPRARVRREGKPLEIAAEELVPGDIVLLEAGDRVPADGRVLVFHSAEVQEAALTGESQAVAKQAGPVPEGAPLAERENMVYMNTVVTRGRLEVLVTATGMATEMGRLLRLLAEARESPTPLQVQLDHLGKRLTLIAGGVIGLIFAVDLWRGLPLVQIVLTAIALAVAAIPEGLPAVVTVTLAIGMHRMARNRAVVKKLAAVETLGCTTVIGSDKTGTLTLNQMTARAVFFQGARLRVTGEGYAGAGEILAEEGVAPELAPLVYPAALCNDSHIQQGELIGDPTEGALLALAAKAGVDPESLAEARPRLAEIPFDSANKFMATFHREGERVRLYVKGAPDVLSKRSTRWLAPVGAAPLTEADRARFKAENGRLAEAALRVLAVARKDIPARDFDPGGNLMAHLQELTLVGLIGIIDPPRPEAKEAIALCRRAGVQVKMITGDHQITAAAIARELGLAGEALTGLDLDRLPAEELPARVEAAAVFARVAPEHKVSIVQTLKSRGHVVAMTGDGVNDAPALKSADIGVAMGVTGTEVAKEAATMVLTDDNFATIVRAVREGRVIYENIVKFVRFQLSTNIGAILTVLTASLIGLPTPFTAIQILWINIIMDGPPAMTLGIEPARPGVMDEPPRPLEARILTAQRLTWLLFYGVIMAAGTLAVFRYGLNTGGKEHALTLAFTTFVLFQVCNVFNARAEHGSAFNRQFLRNRQLWAALAGVVALQAVVVHWGPAQAVFATTDLTAFHWLLAAAVAASVLFLDEARKGLLGVLRNLRRKA